jgi:hypothetical protein
MATKSSSKSTGKVGTDPEALKNVGGKGDFGIPARDAKAYAHLDDIEGRPAGSAPGNTGARGLRTTGVGSAGGEPGHDSGGDLDTDTIGFGEHGAIAAKPVTGHVDGPDDAGDPSATFASGKRSEGRGNLKPGTHGAAPKFKGDTVDHSGTDASTIGPNAGGTTATEQVDEPGAEGEIGLDEARGDVEQGGEV